MRAGPARLTSRPTAAVQTMARLAAALSLIIGVLGFLPGVTSSYASLALFSNRSEAMLLGVFQVSVLHNIIHLVVGVIGLVVAGRRPSARLYLVFGGAFYLLLFVYGLITSQDSAGNFVPVNTADDVLHLALGSLMVIFGLVLGVRISARPRPA